MSWHSDNEMVNLRDVIETLCYMVNEDSDGVEEVLQLPTIDLVRCKECKWAKANGTYQWCGRLDSTARIKADDYCSYGEREDEPQMDDGTAFIKRHGLRVDYGDEVPYDLKPFIDW